MATRARMVLVLVVALSAACSVTVPRDEALTIRSDGGSLVPGEETGSGGDGQALAPGDEGDGRAGEQDGSIPAGPSGPRAVSGPRSSTPSGGPGPGQPAPDAPGGRTAAPTVGVTADSIVVSVAWPFSGPLGQIYENFYTTAILTWADDVNARGGIHGRKIVLKRVDNRGTVDGQVAACREVQSNGSFVAMIEGSIGDTEANCLDEAGFPAMHSTAETRLPTWTSVWAVTSSEAGRTLGSFIRGPLGGAGKKVGVIHTENYHGYREAAEQGLQEAGLDLVRTEVVASNQASFVSELLRLRDSGAEVVVILTAQEVIGILRDARAIGYSPTWTGLPWAADELSLAAGDLMTGIKGLRFWTTSESEHYRRFVELSQQHGNGAPTTASMGVHGTALVLGRALELAGPELDREALREGFRRMESYDPGVVPPVGYADGGPVGTSAQFPVQCCNERREWFGAGPASDRF